MQCRCCASSPYAVREATHVAGCCPHTIHAPRLSPAAYLPAAACALQETKRLLREDFAQEWLAYAGPEAAYAWALLNSPPVVEQLGAVLERLSGKKPPAQQQKNSRL